MSTWKKLLLTIVVVLLLAVAGFVIWAYTPLGPMPEALAALESDANVLVTTEPWYSFEPTDERSDTGLIIYPGGRVDPRSYAPTAKAIAAQGYPVVIVPMPLNLAVFGVNKASDVMAAMPEVQQWAIAGHSLGGAMGANFVKNNPQTMDGLALWASYPANNDDLSGRTDLAATSIYGTADGVASMDDVLGGAPRLPADTVWVPIEGGNHAQFGWYGPQSDADVATISREEQQAQIIAATVSLLERVGGGAQ